MIISPFLGYPQPGPRLVQQVTHEYFEDRVFRFRPSISFLVIRVPIITSQ